MRLDAYYYGFDSTGNDAIDLVLSAVACAGKAFHKTDCWMDEAEPSRYNERLRGETMVEGIQNAANDAAKLLADRDAEIERLRAECGQYRWRMVEDELPPTETEVLLHLAPWVWGDPIMTGFMDEGSFVVHGYGSGNRVLAWMPLPPKLRGME